MIINMSVAATITSVSSFNSILSKAGLYYIETNSSIRQTLISLGLFPTNTPGNYTARKIGDNYFFLEFESYTRRKWFTTIFEGTVNPWTEVVTDINGVQVANASGALNVNGGYRIYINPSNHVMTVFDTSGTRLGYTTLQN